MWLEAIVSKDDVTALMAELLPMCIHLGEAPDAEHYLELFEAKQVSLVEGQGLRMTCRARIRWPILGMDLPVTVESVTLLLCPSIQSAPGRDELVFKLEVDAIDFRVGPSGARQPHRREDQPRTRQKASGAQLALRRDVGPGVQASAVLRPLDAIALNVAWAKSA